MISVEEAKSLISKNSVPLKPARLSIEDASDHILAEDVFANCDIPAFRQSSMDGYALSFKNKDIPLTIRGEMAAGTSQPLRIEDTEAMRIFTGAPLPGGADTVVMQEKTIVKEGKLFILDENLQTGINVRGIGAEIKNRRLAMPKGSYLNPAAIGFLAGIGIDDLLVYPKARVSIIVTGKELQSPGQPLAFGQVYESNSYSLKAALKRAGIHQIGVFSADDDLQILKNILQEALLQSDIVLLTGGVSVGDYDFVTEACRLCNVEQIFHKVKQKPGKPLYFGRQHDKLVFGLPGNPSSVLSCFYNYVLPAAGLLSQRENRLNELKAKLTDAYHKPAGLTHFLKGIYRDGWVNALDAQESFRLSSFASANCLIRLEESQEKVQQGETINVILLPQ